MAETAKRQYVSFSFYKVSENFRKLSGADQERGTKKSFVAAVEAFSKEGILLAYSTLGFKAQTDIMLWRISYDLDSFQRMDSRIFKCALGPYLSQPASYLAMTKGVVFYIDKAPA